MRFLESNRNQNLSSHFGLRRCVAITCDGWCNFVTTWSEGVAKNKVKCKENTESRVQSVCFESDVWIATGLDSGALHCTEQSFVVKFWERNLLHRQRANSPPLECRWRKFKSKSRSDSPLQQRPPELVRYTPSCLPLLTENETISNNEWSRWAQEDRLHVPPRILDPIRKLMIWFTYYVRFPANMHRVFNRVVL